jgi:streptogramin lyase
MSLTYCGGNGGASTAPSPPPDPIPTQVVVVSGDRQSTFAGGSLLLPVHFAVRDNRGKPVAALLTLTSSPGVRMLAQPANGPVTDLQAMVALPDIAFSQFTITATASTGGTAQATAFSGPHLLQVFGNASGLNGAVAADGTYYSLGSGGTINANSGGAAFGPDGTLTTFLGSPSKKLNVPDPGALWGSFGNSVLITPDQSIYFNNGVGYLCRLNNSLDLVSFTPVNLPGLFAVANSGDIYSYDRINTVSIYDSQGSLKSKVTLPLTGTVLSIVANATGNIVFLTFDGVANSLEEFTTAGKSVRIMPLALSYPAENMVQDSQGRYVVYDRSSVSTWDPQGNLVQAITSSNGVFGNGFFAGMDSTNNVYLSYGSGITKFDSSGNLVWWTALPDQVPLGMPLPIFVSPLGDAPTSIGASPSGDVYVEDGGTVKYFLNGVYGGSFASAGRSMALDSGGQLYFATTDYNTGTSSIAVLDEFGNPVRSSIFPQIGKTSGITVDSADNKYVVDLSGPKIHHLDANDQYIGSTPVNLPVGQSFDSGRVALAPDGTWIVYFSSLLPAGSQTPSSFVKKLNPDGTEVWSVSLISDSRVRNLAVDSQGTIYLLRGSQLDVWNSAGDPIGRVDLVYPAGNHGADLLGMTSVQDNVYFYFAGKLYVVSGS